MVSIHAENASGDEGRTTRIHERARARAILSVFSFARPAGVFTHQAVDLSGMYMNVRLPWSRRSKGPWPKPRDSRSAHIPRHASSVVTSKVLATIAKCSNRVPAGTSGLRAESTAVGVSESEWPSGQGEEGPTLEGKRLIHEACCAGAGNGNSQTDAHSVRLAQNEGPLIALAQQDFASCCGHDRKVLAVSSRQDGIERLKIISLRQKDLHPSHVDDLDARHKCLSVRIEAGMGEAATGPRQARHRRSASQARNDDKVLLRLGDTLCSPPAHSLVLGKSK